MTEMPLPHEIIKTVLLEPKNIRSANEQKQVFSKYDRTDECEHKPLHKQNRVPV